MLKRSRLVAWAIVLGAALTSTSARAEFPKLAGYVGVTGGVNGATRRWDIGTGEHGYPNTGASGLVGVRLGMHVHPQLALEGQLAYIPLQGAGEINTLLSYDFNLLIHLLPYDLTPTLSAGIGGYGLVSGRLGSDNDLRGHLGVGLRGMMLPWLAVRGDLRTVFSDGFDTPGAMNLEFTVGLDVFFWRLADSQPPPPPAGPADRDKDGIADTQDACPEEAGPRATNGCPDTDGDGVADKDDACPGAAGTKATQGCPDKDADGVLDQQDRCPDKAGPKELKGCPDQDGDQVADLDDRCPRQPGPAALKGCPDKDGDHVPDVDDNCPEVAGLPEAHGCLPEKAKQFTGSIKGITFAAGSSKVLKPSFKVLDQAVAVLKEFPTFRLRIEGHTDNVGKQAQNQSLSQARAEAVKAYFTQKGIVADRLEAVGYGDSKPMTTNKTKAGRALNRRIEFTALPPAAAAPASK